MGNIAALQFNVREGSILLFVPHQPNPSNRPHAPIIIKFRPKPPCPRKLKKLHNFSHSTCFIMVLEMKQRPSTILPSTGVN